MTIKIKIDGSFITAEAKDNDGFLYVTRFHLKDHAKVINAIIRAKSETMRPSTSDEAVFERFVKRAGR